MPWICIPSRPPTVLSGTENKPSCSSRTSLNLSEPEFSISSFLIIIEFNGADDKSLSIFDAVIKTSSSLSESPWTFLCEKEKQELIINNIKIWCLIFNFF